MDLIINQMVKFQVVHVTDGNGSVEILTGTSVTETNLTVCINGNSFPKLTVISILGEIIVYALVEISFVERTYKPFRP